MCQSKSKHSTVMESQTTQLVEDETLIYQAVTEISKHPQLKSSISNNNIKYKSNESPKSS